MQLDLFVETDETPYDLKARVDHFVDLTQMIDERTRKVQRGIFARHNEICKMYMELKQEFEELRDAIGLQKKQASIYELFGSERAI